MRNPITFSTLACPEWAIETIIRRASEFGYDGIEWRGGSEGHIQPSMSSSERAELRRMLADEGLFALAVTAYTGFVSPNAAEREANIDELRRYVNLAADLGAKYVRAFVGQLASSESPGRLAPGANLDAIYRVVASCFETVATHAQSAGVRIAIEPHDDFVRSSTVTPILEQISHPALGVVWDIGNAFAAGEDPAEGHQLLGKRLFYVHVKDYLRQGTAWQLTPLGEGEVPLARAFTMLLASGYRGAFSVEWERAWHPELDPPEIALPAALKTVRALLTSARQTKSEAPRSGSPV